MKIYSQKVEINNLHIINYFSVISPLVIIAVPSLRPVRNPRY